MHDGTQKKTVPLTEAQRDLLRNGELIRDQLPVRFRTGFILETYLGTCWACNREIPEDALVGTINQSFKNVIVIEALGGCEHCMVVTPFHLRVYADRSYGMKVGTTWYRKKFPYKSLRERGFETLRRWFTK